MHNSTFSGAAIRHKRAENFTKPVSMSAPDPSLMESVLARLRELRQLPYGWDGYRGVAVSYENAHFAAQVILQICGINAPAPSIVPGSSGDLQIEWHTLHGDLELHVVRPYEVHATISYADTDECKEKLLTVDFSTAANWLLSITEDADAVPAAA